MNGKAHEFVLHSTPHFVAVQYWKYLQEPHIPAKIEYGLRTFELILRVLSMSLVSQYLIRDIDRLSDPLLNRLLLEKLPNATLDTWQKILFCTLQTYSGQRHLFFMPELYDFYWNTEFEPHELRPEVEETFDRLTQFHNDWDIGSYPNTEVEWHERNNTVAALLDSILEQLIFLSGYELIRVREIHGDLCWIDRHTGLEIDHDDVPVQTMEQLKEGTFYFTNPEGEFLELHPLVIVLHGLPLEQDQLTNQVDTGLYDRYVQGRLRYLAGTLWMTMLEQQPAYDFLRLLNYSIEQIKRERQEVRRLSWWQLKQTALELSRHRLAGALVKGHHQLFVPRDYAWQAFEDFLDSDAVCFVLTGKSGVGKSSFLVELAERYSQNHPETCFLFYNAGKLGTEYSITKTVGHDFDRHLKFGDDEGGSQAADIWQRIAGIDGIESKKVILCLDAINENSDAKAVLRDIDDLVENTTWPWLKIIITTRPEAWRSMKRGVKLAEPLYYRSGINDRLAVEPGPFDFSLELEPFSRGEFQHAYNNYRNVFNLETEYSDLPNSTKSLLRDPLLLRLVASIYCGGGMPPEIEATGVIEQYLDFLVATEVLTVHDIRFIEYELMPVMIGPGHYANFITTSEINSVVTHDGKTLFDLIHNEGKLSDGQRINRSFLNCVDAGILVGHGDTQSFKIGFDIERFYDYFAARRLRQVIFESDGAFENQYRIILQKVHDYPFLWGALKNVVQAELSDGQDDLIVSLCQTDDQTVKELMVTVLQEEKDEASAQLAGLLRRLMDVDHKDTRGQGWSFWLRILFRRKDPIFSREVLNARKIAVEVAEKIGDLAILQDAALSDSSPIRTHAVKHILHLWEDDREKLRVSTFGNRGFGILSDLAKMVRTGLLPNLNALESGTGVLLSIFFAQYQQPDDQADTDLLSDLLTLSRATLARLLYIGDRGLRDTIVRNRLRDWLVTAAISFSARWVHDTPDHTTGDFGNLGTYFALAPDDRGLLLVLLPYYDASFKDMQPLENCYERFLGVNDTITTFALWQVLIWQWNLGREDVLRVIQLLFEEGMRSAIPTYSCMISLTALAAILRQGRADQGTADIYRAMVISFLESSNGRVAYSSRTFVRTLTTSYFEAMYGTYGYVETSVPQVFVERAIKRNDTEYLSSVLYDLGQLVSERRFHKGILGLLALIAVRDEVPLRGVVSNLLARLRQYCPYEVDDFMSELGWSDERQRAVRILEIKENIGGDIISLPVYRFGADLGVEYPFLRENVAWVMRRAYDSKNLRRWLNDCVKRLVNLVYGDEVFRGH